MCLGQLLGAEVGKAGGKMKAAKIPDPKGPFVLLCPTRAHTHTPHSGGWRQ